MNKESFGLKWIKFFLMRDTVGKSLLALSAGLITSWFLFAKDSVTFGIVAGGSLIFTALFSLLHYATLGQYKQRAEIRFYDAIRHDCDLPGDYQGRDLKQIKVEWKGFRVSRVTVNAASNSSAAKSAKEWRSIKLSVEDSFKIAGTRVVALLGNQSAGRLVFVAGNEDQFVPGGELSGAEFKEGLYSFTYEILADYGVPLPRLQNFKLHEDGKRKPRLESVQVDLMNTQSAYDKKTFESSFRQRYASEKHVWTFDWTPTGVDIKSVAKGSQHEKSMQATRSITELVAASVISAFHLYSGEGYEFAPNMVDWSSDGTTAIGINIDFLQTDISRPDQIERFEKLMAQGLYQLFRGVEYSYTWSVDAFEKNLTIEAI